MHVEWYHLGLGSTGCRHGRSLFESPMHFRVVSPSSLLANSPHVQSHVHFPMPLCARHYCQSCLILSKNCLFVCLFVYSSPQCISEMFLQVLFLQILLMCNLMYISQCHCVLHVTIARFAKFYSKTILSLLLSLIVSKNVYPLYP